MSPRTSGILLISAVLCFSGCDFLRRTAGRPTSADIAAARDAIAAARQKAADDSARAAALAAFADSVATAVADSIAAASDSVAFAVPSDSVAFAVLSDSVAFAAPADSAAAEGSVAPEEGAPADQPDTAAPEAKLYYAVIGAFSNGGNAEKLASKCRNAGLDCTLIEKNSLLCVCICPAPSAEESYDLACLMAKRYPFFPKDIWVIRDK